MASVKFKDQLDAANKLIEILPKKELNDAKTIVLCMSLESVILTDVVCRGLNLSYDYIYGEAHRKYEEKILKNVYKYRKGNLIGELKGKNILLIDEGCETGMTALICIKTLLDVKVKSISYATPMIATDVFANLNDMVDEIYTINKIVDFIDVDSYYEKKIEATSERIMSILEESPHYLPLQKQQGDKNNAI